MSGKMIFVLLPLIILIISATISSNATINQNSKIPLDATQNGQSPCFNASLCGVNTVNASIVALGIVILVTALAIAALAGLNVAGLGGSSETSHMAFMISIFAGIWILFTGLDGFNPFSQHAVDFQPPNSIFTGLNTIGNNCGQIIQGHCIWTSY